MTMAAIVAFFLALSKLLLLALIVWGLILLLPLADWMRRAAQVLLLLIVIFALLSDVIALQVTQSDLPYPLNPNTPTNPSRVK